MSISAEDSLIARYFRPLATTPGALALVDDAAIIPAAGSDDLVVTTDAIVEGVHFLPDDPPDTLARKALRVNLSDLAAKGAIPAGFLLTLALGRASDQFLQPFATALGEDAAAFGCPLLGGDTVSTSGPIMISVTVFGHVPKGAMLRRDAAQPGDLIFVSGTIGDAVLGLDLLKGGRSVAALAGEPDDRRACLVDRYRVPQPRNALLTALRTHARAAMDVSDGLAGDLAKLCAASHVSARVELHEVPLSDAARAVLGAGATRLADLVGGGDDYEVLCTVPAARAAAFSRDALAAGVRVTAIGKVLAGREEPVFHDPEGRPVTLEKLSFSHF